jgi:hypothetical protein
MFGLKRGSFDCLIGNCTLQRVPGARGQWFINLITRGYLAIKDEHCDNGARSAPVSQVFSQAENHGGLVRVGSVH